MKRTLSRALLVLFAIAAGSCNQPFEPDGPVSNKLVVYSILDMNSATQYVRVGTTYQTPPGPIVRDARVALAYNGFTTYFRDTTISLVDSSGAVTTMNLYFAPQVAINPGTTYTLQVSTPAGLSVSASTTTLIPPVFSLTNPVVLDSLTGDPFTLNVFFKSISGAAVLHFYVDFYAFVDGGWEFHRAEVPLSSSSSGNGSTTNVYPTLTLVQTIGFAISATPIVFDPEQYTRLRAEVIKQYPEAPIRWLQAEFVLTQIDDALFNYYYVYNGPVDQSSIRLDQPDFSNIPHGLGVFGSSLSVTMTYPIKR